MPASAKSGEQTRRYSRVVERHRGHLVEVSAQPAGAGALMTRRVLLRDQRGQLERVEQAYPGELARGDLGDDEVAAIECSSENGGRVAL